ncbi:MAG: GAF domain-containing protein, partial [Nitrospirae bacterium]|nr:GAF domain-containing protein [Nitrospirota bacterium]
ELTATNELLTAEVAERKHLEKINVKGLDIQKTINSILSIALETSPLDTRLDKILHLILSLEWLSFESMGCIFLADGETLRMNAHYGLPKENLLLCENVPLGKCVCGMAAARGKLVFKDGLDENHETIYDGIVNHGHYCVPIMHGSKNLGILNLYVKEGHKQKDEEVNFLNNVANTMAGIILRNKDEEEIINNYLIQHVLSQILRLSVEALSLKEQLQKTLDIISNVSWLSSSSTGCIFLVEDNPDILVMKAHRGISLELFNTCSYLPMGKCLCGRAAQTGETIFKSSLDEHHQIRYEGMINHGHYCVPIKSKDKVLGVI